MLNRTERWCNWFSFLARDLKQSKAMTEEGDIRALINEMKDFRASRSVDDDLRRTYPTERAIEQYAKSTPPHKKTIDFVLSFLNTNHQNKSCKFSVLAAEEIDGNLSKDDTIGLSILSTEQFRRSQYWQKRKGLIRADFEGAYIIHRYNNKREYKREVCNLICNPAHPQLIDLYWVRTIESLSYLYYGNLWCSIGFLSGNVFRRSSDEIFKPLNVHILNDSNSIPDTVVHAGSITGTTQEMDEIFHYSIALQKVAGIEECFDFKGNYQYEEYVYKILSDNEISRSFFNETLQYYLDDSRSVTRGGDIGKAVRETWKNSKPVNQP